MINKHAIKAWLSVLSFRKFKHVNVVNNIIINYFVLCEYAYVKDNIIYITQLGLDKNTELQRILL